MLVSNGNNNRKRGGGNQGGGGGGGNQQRRRRSGGQGGGNNPRPQAPSGPAMTALGESTYEAVFDHGGQGYGVWFDGIIRDDPMYKQFWKGTGTRPLFVRIEEDRIVLLKEVDLERPQSLKETEFDSAAETAAIDEAQVDAAIEEAVAEALAAAEAATADDAVDADGEKVYTPEEAAALFTAGEDNGDAPLDGSDIAVEEDAEPAAEVKPKRRAVRKKPVAKKADADADAGDE
jgi:hypothetical protein